MALTAKKQRFVDEYLIDLNATQAAIRASYSQKTAASQGERLLRNVEVRKYLASRRKDLQARGSIRHQRRQARPPAENLVKHGFA